MGAREVLRDLTGAGFSVEFGQAFAQRLLQRSGGHGFGPAAVMHRGEHVLGSAASLGLGDDPAPQVVGDQLGGDAHRRYFRAALVQARRRKTSRSGVETSRASA